MGRQTDSTPPGSADSGSGPAVVYFAKVPAPGRVKTRLCPPLTAAEAAGLYAGFVRDAVVPVPGVRTLCYAWPEGELDALRPLLPPGVEIRPQRGADLWARMIACMGELFAAGHRPVLIRNTDSPDLPRERVADAIARCGAGRVVLGPDAGGGYYLVALAEPCPELFTDVAAEGAASVFAATVAKAESLGLRVEALPEERDVDDFDDLLALWRARAGRRR